MWFPYTWLIGKPSSSQDILYFAPFRDIHNFLHFQPIDNTLVMKPIILKFTIRSISERKLLQKQGHFPQYSIINVAKPQISCPLRNVILCIRRRPAFKWEETGQNWGWNTTTRRLLRNLPSNGRRRPQHGLELTATAMVNFWVNGNHNNYGILLTRERIQMLTIYIH